MTTRPRNRNWIWFFLVLGFLAVSAVSISWFYNSRQQLTVDELARNRALWDQKGPKDYTLEYTLKGGATGAYVVQVRNGEVVSAEPDERPLAVKRAYYGMPALYDDIETFMELDKKSKRRPFQVATFHADHGGLIRFVRRVPGTSERVEINVKLTEEPAGSPLRRPTQAESRQRGGG